MNNEKLGYYGVFELISKGVYDVEHSKPKTLLKDTDIIDENKSVKWNKEQNKKKNEKIKLHNEATKEAKEKGHRIFKDDLTVAIMGEHSLNADQASRVYRKAFEDGYSAGLNEILWAAQEIGSLAEAILWLA